MTSAKPDLTPAPSTGSPPTSGSTPSTSSIPPIPSIPPILSIQSIQSVPSIPPTESLPPSPSPFLAQSSPAADNLTWHPTRIDREARERLNGHRGATLWFTGLSGSGKSTLANEVVSRLHARGVRTALLDGDNVRHGLNRDLGFSPEDRTENIRRIGEVAKLMSEAGLVVLVAFISPYRRDRELARALHDQSGSGVSPVVSPLSPSPPRFLEVYVKADLAVCEGRDPKGLYRRARSGEIAEFTGVSAPYESPENPEIVVDTGRLSVGDAAEEILRELERRGLFAPGSP